MEVQETTDNRLKRRNRKAEKEKEGEKVVERKGPIWGSLSLDHTMPIITLLDDKSERLRPHYNLFWSGYSLSTTIQKLKKLKNIKMEIYKLHLLELGKTDIVCYRILTKKQKMTILAPSFIQPLSIINIHLLIPKKNGSHRRKQVQKRPCS